MTTNDRGFLRTASDSLNKRLVSPLSQQLTPQRRHLDSSYDEASFVARQRNAYRLVLLALAVVLAPINAHNFYRGETVPALAGLGFLILLGGNIYRMTAGRDALVPPAAVLLAAVVTIAIWLLYGQFYSLYWIYPLLVALPILLHTRVAVWLGVFCGLLAAPIVFLRFDTGTAIVISLSMAHTWLISAWLSFAFTEQSERLSLLAMTDPLTGVFNRRHLQRVASDALGRWRNEQRPSSLLLLDVDHFKQVNDRYGHAMGDTVLCDLVALLHRRLRSDDVLCRYGGEEFAVLLFDTTAQQSLGLADELRRSIAEAPLVEDMPLTVSIGLSDLTQVSSVDEWLQISDAALYEAKDDGRDRVILARPLAAGGSDLSGQQADTANTP